MVVSFLISTLKLLSTVTFFFLLHLYINFTETKLRSVFLGLAIGKVQSEKMGSKVVSS